MTSSHPVVSRAIVRVLGDAPVAPSAPPPPEVRARAIASIGAAIRASRVRRTRRRWLTASAVGTLAAAAALVLLLGRGSVAPLGGGIAGVDGQLTRDPSGAAFESGAALAAGDELRAGSQGGALALRTGTRLALDRGTRLGVEDVGAAQVFRLGEGALRADVAKLVTGQRFVIRTVDAEVEVRGTSFRVSHGAPEEACARGTTTRVEVFEGVVTVRAGGGETEVKGGERWPSCAAWPERAEAPAASASVSSRVDEPHGEALPPPAPSTTPSEAARPRPAARAADSVAASAPPREATGLAAQNDAFSEAVAAARSGQSARAVALFDRFLAAYPRSPLGESVVVQRMKLLGRSEAGRAAARDYLARFPSGFARADAKAILTGP